MKNKKLWKQLTALLISVILLIPTPTVFAVEESWGADADGFLIQDGELMGYIGTAKEVVIPDGVTSIGVRSAGFYQNDYVTSVIIPESVTDIGESAFWRCSKLTSIKISKGVASIGKRAFSGCKSLKNLQVDKDNVNYVSENNILYNKDKTILFCCAAGVSGNITIPDGVTSIEAGAFEGCSSLKSIIIPNSVTSIGEYAFYDCKNLTEATIPEGVESIGGNAFFNCEKLKSIRIPDSVTSIGEWAFSFCMSLKSIAIPGSVTSIGKNAFANCSNLEDITIPEGVESIEDNTFNDCEKLKSIRIPDSVTSIGKGAFQYCWSLESITVPKSVISIGESAFNGCYSMKSLQVNADNANYSSENDILYTKDKKTLILCPGRKTGTVAIPNGVTSIERWAFSGCSSLKGITIPKSVVSIGESAFSGCEGLTNITIPEGVTSIERWAFSGCSGLKKFTIPKRVSSIGEGAFGQCKSLESISIPASVTSIGESAFFECESLYCVIIPNSVTSIGNIAFGNCSDELTIYGKAGSCAQTYAKKYKIPFSTGTPKAAQALSVTRTYSKTYGNKPFKLNAKVTKGNGALSYTSSNKQVVTVDKKGNVTIKGTGIAVITVTAKETSKYKKATTQITIEVRPAKPKTLNLKALGGKKLKVSWKVDKNVTGYEIQYGTDKSFKDKKVTKILTINKSKTTSTIMKNLEKGKTYYVRIHSYKKVKVDGKTQKLYSAWSSVKNVMVK